MIQRSYDGKATLYVVPTPIGNLEDMTFRSISVLNEVDVVCSEDTRITRQLFNHFNVSNKLISNNKNNENFNVSKIIDFLTEGKKVALVSDRGTPGISDPGYIAVKEAIKKGFNVVCLPGANALVPAIVMSGLDTSKFLFYGFLNSKSSKRKQELENLKPYPFTLALYEAPHRIRETLNDIFCVFGDRKIALVREISKLYEEITRENLSVILDNLETIKGEFVIVIDGNKDVETFESVTLEEQFEEYINQGLTEKEAIKKIAKDRKVNKNEIYQHFKAS